MIIEIREYLVQHLKKGTFLWKTLEFLQGMLYVKNYLFYYKWHWIKNSSSTRELNIEFSSFCNLRCAFCSLDHKKPKVNIEPELLDKFFHDLTADRRFRKVEVIHLHNGGETLLHNKIGELLGIIKKYKDIYKSKKQKFPTVNLLTNGIPLTEKKSIEIIESGAIDVMRFSMDGGNPKRFEEIRINAKWELFHKNLTFFIEENIKQGAGIKTNIISMLDHERPISTNWMSGEFKEMYNAVDTYELRHPHTWAGEVDIEGDPGNNMSKPHKIGCGLLMHQLVLLPDGDVTVCCADLNSKGVIGNIKENSLFDIYNSPKRRKWLELMFKRKKDQIDLCKNCETF